MTTTERAKRNQQAAQRRIRAAKARAMVEQRRA